MLERPKLHLNGNLVDRRSPLLTIRQGKMPYSARLEDQQDRKFYSLSYFEGLGNLVTQNVNGIPTYVCYDEVPVNRSSSLWELGLGFDTIKRELKMGVGEFESPKLGAVLELSNLDRINIKDQPLEDEKEGKPLEASSIDSLVRSLAHMNMTVLDPKGGYATRYWVWPDRVVPAHSFSLDSKTEEMLRAWGLTDKMPEKVNFPKTWDTAIDRIDKGDFGPPVIFSR